MEIIAANAIYALSDRCRLHVDVGGHSRFHFNNFLSDIFHLQAGTRGWLELPRELPGFLVVIMAGVLAAGCLVWLPYKAGMFNAGAAAPIFETLFTLIFVASAVFLAAGSAVLGNTALTLGRTGLVMAPLLLAMYLRKWWPDAGVVLYVVPALGALVLAAQARLGWQVLKVAPAAG